MAAQASSDASKQLAQNWSLDSQGDRTTLVAKRPVPDDGASALLWGLFLLVGVVFGARQVIELVHEPTTVGAVLGMAWAVIWVPFSWRTFQKAWSRPTLTLTATQLKVLMSNLPPRGELVLEKAELTQTGVVATLVRHGRREVLRYALVAEDRKKKRHLLLVSEHEADMTAIERLIEGSWGIANDPAMNSVEAREGLPARVDSLPRFLRGEDERLLGANAVVTLEGAEAPSMGSAYRSNADGRRLTVFRRRRRVLRELWVVPIIGMFFVVVPILVLMALQGLPGFGVWLARGFLVVFMVVPIMIVQLTLRDAFRHFRWPVVLLIDGEKLTIGAREIAHTDLRAVEVVANSVVVRTTDEERIEIDVDMKNEEEARWLARKIEGVVASS